MQKPVVKMLVGARPPVQAGSRSVATPVRMSAATVSQVISDTWGEYSNSAPRLPRPAVRAK